MSAMGSENGRNAGREFRESLEKQVDQFSRWKQYILRHRYESCESCESQEVSSHIYTYVSIVLTQVTQMNLQVSHQALEKTLYILKAVCWHVWLWRTDEKWWIHVVVCNDSKASFTAHVAQVAVRTSALMFVDFFYQNEQLLNNEPIDIPLHCRLVDRDPYNSLL